MSRPSIVEVLRDMRTPFTIQAADEIERLQTENWQLRQACGYPIPADKETPQNPFKCGICDARAIDAAATPSNDLADKIELHLNLDKGSPGFHLGDDDLREVVRALRAAAPLSADGEKTSEQWLQWHIKALEAEFGPGSYVYVRSPDAAQAMTDRCVKCGCETKGEMAFVNGGIWCHPCADAAQCACMRGGDPLGNCVECDNPAARDAANEAREAGK